MTTPQSGPTPDAAPAVDPRPNPRKKWIIAIGATVAVVAVIGWVMAATGSFDSALNPRETTAKSECQNTVGDELKSPASAKFTDVTANDGGAYVLGDLPSRFDSVSNISVLVVTGKVDAENSYGTLLRNKFNCRAVFSGDDFVGTELRFIEAG